MTGLTQQKAFELSLTQRGQGKVMKRTNRYVQLQAVIKSVDGTQEWASDRFYWLGNAGSFRVGRSRSESIPVSQRVKDFHYTAGEAIYLAERAQVQAPTATSLEDLGL